MNPHMFFQHFFNALTLGSLYGLIAIGYTMVYGILRLINFAHGDILMLGAYFVFYGTTLFFLPWGWRLWSPFSRRAPWAFWWTASPTVPCATRRAFPRLSAPLPYPSLLKAWPWWSFLACPARCTSRNG